jgi:hypothetical protein
VHPGADRKTKVNRLPGTFLRTENTRSPAIRTLIELVLHNNKPSRPGIAPVHHLERAIAAAKSAFLSGNELAALDAFHLCGGKHLPAWVENAMPVDPRTARHRRKKTGRHARAFRFTEEQIEHVERYHAVVFARRYLREPWRVSSSNPDTTNAYQAAREFLRTSCQKQVNVLSIKRSYKLVARAANKENSPRFWVPASHQVLSLFRKEDCRGWVCDPTNL